MEEGLKSNGELGFAVSLFILMVVGSLCLFFFKAVNESEFRRDKAFMPSYSITLLMQLRLTLIASLPIINSAILSCVSDLLPCNKQDIMFGCGKQHVSSRWREFSNDFQTALISPMALGKL